MKKMFKAVCLPLALVMVCTALAACGGSSNGPAEGQTKITIWSSDSHSQKVYDQLIKEYNEGEGKEKGIYIDYVIQAGDSGGTNLELALQSGDGPDLFGGDVKKMAENGYIVALEDLPNTQDLIDYYKEYLRPDVNVLNGKTYSVPVFATTRGLVYNKDMFKAAGIVDEKGEAKPPVTFAEFVEDAKKLTNKDKGEFGIVLPMKWSSWYASDIQAMLYQTVGFDGFNPVTGQYDYSKLPDLMKVYLQIKADGSAYPGGDSMDNDSARAYFSEGKIGMKMAFSFDVGVFNDQFPAKCDWGVAPLPVFDTNEVYKQKQTVGNSYQLNAKSAQDKDKAAKMVEVLKFFSGEKFVTEIYKAGLNIPIKPEIAKKTELPADAKKGWKEFAEMVDISTPAYYAPGILMEGKTTIVDRFTNDVWSGRMSPEEAVQLYQKDVEAGTAEWFKQNPTRKLDEFIDKSWNPKR